MPDKDGLPGDAWNAVFPVSLMLQDEERWSRIKPVPTFEDHALAARPLLSMREWQM